MLTSKNKNIRGILLTAILTQALIVPSIKAKLEISGNRSISRREIISLLGNNSSMREALKKIPLLQEAYFRRGLMLARIRVDSLKDHSGISIKIDEGEPLRYGSIKFKVLSRSKDLDPAGMFDVKKGEVFIPEELEIGIGRILRLYDESGYPFIQAWIESLNVDIASRTLDVSILVMDGGKKLIRGVAIEGLSRTREDVAVKLSGLKNGEPYDGVKVKNAVQRLRTAQVFEEVSDPRIILSPDGRGVKTIIEVVEPKRVSSFIAALGYSQAESNRPRVLSGFASLALKNIAGKLKDLEVNWENDGTGRSETKLSFLNKFTFNRPLGVGVTIEQIGLDTLYTWQSAGLEVTFPVKTFMGKLAKAVLALKADRNVFSSGDLLRSWRLRSTVGISYYLGKSIGWNLGVDARITLARKRSYERGSGDRKVSNQVIVVLRDKINLPIRPFVFHNNSSYRGLESNEELIPISEQFYIGGASSLRGYRENQFHGQRAAFSRFELRLGDNINEHAYLLCDAGYVHLLDRLPSGQIQGRNILRIGFGFGIRTETRLGNVDLSFAVGEKLALRQTKIHVIMGYEF